MFLQVALKYFRFGRTYRNVDTTFITRLVIERLIFSLEQRVQMARLPVPGLLVDERGATIPHQLAQQRIRTHSKTPSFFLNGVVKRPPRLSRMIEHDFFGGRPMSNARKQKGPPKRSFQILGLSWRPNQDRPGSQLHKAVAWHWHRVEHRRELQSRPMQLA